MSMNDFSFGRDGISVSDLSSGDVIQWIDGYIVSYGVVVSVRDDVADVFAIRPAYANMEYYQSGKDEAKDNVRMDDVDLPVELVSVNQGYGTYCYAAVREKISFSDAKLQDFSVSIVSDDVTVPGWKVKELLDHSLDQKELEYEYASQNDSDVSIAEAKQDESSLLNAVSEHDVSDGHKDRSNKCKNLEERELPTIDHGDSRTADDIWLGL